jgi:hypothetical protein
MQQNARLLPCLVFVTPQTPGGHYMHRQFNIQKFYFLPTQCICVFCVDLRTNISLYSINWLVFITETECLLRGTGWIFIYVIQYRQV